MARKPLWSLVSPRYPVPVQPSHVAPAGSRGSRNLVRGNNDHDRTGQSAIANSHKPQATGRDALEGRWKKLHWH